jgi:hypothetical protein
MGIQNRKYILVTYFIALVWFVNGFFCKVLNLVPRHEQIVAQILGCDNARFFTICIGCAEIMMTIWIVSRIRMRINAVVQIVVVASMNFLEFLLVPDLLLWGRMNAVFALLFIGLIYYNEFILNRKSNNEK